MENLGAGFYMEKPGGQLRTHEFGFYITDGKEIPTATDHTGLGDREIAHSISFTIEDGIVQKIKVSIQTIKYIDEFTDYWQQYSVKKILAQNGVPDKVEFKKTRYGGEVTDNGSFDMEIYYKEKGITITENATNNQSLICPDIKDNLVQLDYIFEANGAGTSPSETNAADWKSVDETLGITKEEFYNRIISSSRRECFPVSIHNDTIK
jgi:hypothetical protein